MYLPGPIYESIPTIYMVSGLSSVFLIDLPFSIASAGLFAYASWMVWKMRKDYRKRQSFTNKDQIL